MIKTKKFKKPVLMLALILIVSLFGAGLSLADDVNIESDFVWQGQGSENAICNGVNADWHWILTPGGANQFIEATLYVSFKDGSEVSAPGVFRGGERGALHFNILKADGGTVESAYVDFSYSGSPGGNFVLTISSLDCDEDETGYLVITKKAYVADEDGVRTLDEDTKTKFAFEIHDANGLVQDGITLVNGESTEAIELKLGTYTVKEVDDGGYEADQDVFNGIELTAGDTKVVNFINVRTEGFIIPPPPGGNDATLTITKKAYVTDEDDKRTLATDTKSEFTFEIKDTDGKVVKTIKLKNGGSTTVILPAGSYTVKEIDDGGYVADQYLFEVTLVEGEEKTLDFINVRSEKLPVTSGMDGLFILFGVAVAGRGLMLRRRLRK